MKNILLTIIFTILCSSAVSAQNAANIEGNWLGSLEYSGMKLRLVLKVSKATDGSLAAKLDSLDQGAKDLPIETISMAANSVSFSAPKFGMSFQGTLSEKQDEISGIFKQNSEFPLVFKRINEIPKTNRPQEPQKPFPYDEQDVSYKNSKDNVKIAGTLTTPRDGDKHPAVILITGSGAQDRDETIFGHKPFLLLADYLTRRGIAVLRVDDRGVGGTDAGATDFTDENYAEDVLAGIEFLKGRKEIDAKKIGLIGHSEGGMIAPMVAARSKNVAFIVLMAGLGQTGADVIYTQTELLNKADGSSRFVTEQTIKLLKSVMSILKTEADNKLAAQKIDAAIARQKSDLSEEQKKEFASIEQTIRAQTPMYVSAWFRYFILYNPRPTLEKVKIPVLALNGENDLQVAFRENLGLIETGLKSGGNKNVTVKSFPKLNHLFQTSTTGSTSEYGEINETISPVVLETISNWILKRTK
jgi:pimeloyl-ACP methyl ester carboxylesterase